LECSFHIVLNVIPKGWIVKDWIVYLLKCADDTLYCGITNNLSRRIQMHNAGKGAVYTRGRRPVFLAAKSRNMTRTEAIRLEMVIKKIHKKRKKARLENY